MLARFRSLLDILKGRDRFEREMRDEMAFHLEARATDLERSGHSPAEARRRARLEFGGLDSAKDDCRQARGVRQLDELTQDIRYAVRLMAKSPGFTAAAVFSLALGIGANTAIFSLMDAVMLRTLPVANGQELVFLAHGTSPATAGASANYPLFERYQALTDVFSGVTTFSTTAFKVATADGLEHVNGLWVSGNFHGVLGVDVAHGRGFSAERDRGGPTDIAVISDAFWTRRFGRDPGVLGRTLTIKGRALTIVGVTAPAFTGLVPGSVPDVTLPVALRAFDEPEYLEMHDTWTDMTMVARLKPGVTEQAALAASDAAFQQYMSEAENQWMRKEAPAAYSNAQLVPAARGSSVLRRQYETALNVLMGMVVIVLLIASVNVANLLLVRSAARAKEVAIRLCVGGGRGRLIRQFLTESMLLALAGGALGTLIAIWGTGAIMGLFSVAESPLLLDVSPNPRVLAFTAAVSVLTGILFGLLPALSSTNIDLTPALKDGAPTGGRHRRWSTAHGLVASQVALSVLVLAIAGLLVRSLYNLKTQEAGFTKGNLLLFALDTSGSTMPPAERERIYSGVLSRLRELPGVQSVSGSTSSPIITGGNARALVMPAEVANTMEGRAAFTNLVTPDYFDTLGIRVRRGRGFTAQDTATSQKVVVVNETMARYYAGTRDPLGMTLAFMGNPKQQLTIVGVVEDTHQMNLREPPPRTVYSPLTQPYNQPPSTVTVEIRTAADPALVAGSARAIVREVSQAVVIRYMRTMDEQINASLMRERVLTTLAASFAALALVLSAIGLYGVMSYTVSRRTREIGIRLALGAARARVLWDVLRQTVIVSVIGVAVGLTAALLATKVLSTFLFGLSPRDPITLASVCGLLLVTSLLAGWFPARSAASVDPVRAIKAE